MFVFRDNTYTDRSLSCQLEFEAAPISIVHLLVISVFVSGSHLYLSVIVLSVRVRGRTYIDRPSPCNICLCFGTTPISIGHCLVSLSSGPHLYRSAISLSYRVQFESGPHLYRSVIILSVRVRFESGPHLYRFTISLSC